MELWNYQLTNKLTYYFYTMHYAVGGLCVLSLSRDHKCLKEYIELSTYKKIEILQNRNLCMELKTSTCKLNAFIDQLNRCYDPGSTQLLV